MKNLENVTKKTCLLIDLKTFESIVRTVLKDDTVQVECAWDGISIYNDDDNWSEEEICELLTKYFGVKKVNSFHADDESYAIGVWIVYEE